MVEEDMVLSRLAREIEGAKCFSVLGAYAQVI